MKEIKLTYDKWRATVVPTLGASIKELTFDGADVYVSANDYPKHNGSPLLIGSPLLLPSNRTANGKFVFEGTEYTLPVTEQRSGANLHGSLYKQEFSVVTQSQTKVTMRCKNVGEAYPFPFEITVCYSLSDQGFCQEYVLKNTGGRVMPYTFGLHTTFSAPKTFSVPLKQCQERNEQNLSTGRYIPLSEEQRQYVSGTETKGKAISGYFSSGGNTATVGDYSFSVSENFDHWVLYNAKGERDILCVEPQCGAVDGLNSKDGYRTLKPDETALFFTNIKRA